MSHITYVEGAAPVELSVDYIVVGSGAGGASAAVTLARAGAQVAVVEAGPWRDPQDYPSSTYGAMRDLFENWGMQITMGRALWPIVQGSCVGGTTVINSAISVRTPQDIFELWQREWGLPDLSEPYWRHQETLERELCAEIVPPAARGRSNELAMLADERLGLDGHVMTRYVKGCVGSGQCLQGCKNLRKQSLNLNFIPEVRRRGGTILSSAPVQRVLLKGGRAIGVRGHFVHPNSKKKGARYTVRARKGVLLAASATHTPALLLSSGVRHPMLGRWFRSHPGTGVFGVYRDPVDMNIGATQGWASMQLRERPGLKLETLAIPPEMVASRLSGGGRELMRRLSEYRHLAMWVHAVRAETCGRVYSVGGRPVVRYTLDLPDMHRMRAGVVQVAKMHFAAGAEAIIPGIHGLPYKLTADQLPLLEEAPLDPRAYVAILSHLFGGAVMGADERKAVCDARGRVRGTSNLYVADASAIPTVLGVNPQHTIMALACHVAEGLVGG